MQDFDVVAAGGGVAGPWRRIVRIERRQLVRATRFACIEGVHGTRRKGSIFVDFGRNASPSLASTALRAEGLPQEGRFDLAIGFLACRIEHCTWPFSVWACRDDLYRRHRRQRSGAGCRSASRALVATARRCQSVEATRRRRTSATHSLTPA